MTKKDRKRDLLKTSDLPPMPTECPHCDREESIDKKMTAYAWLVGHIQEVHSDELPSFD